MVATNSGPARFTAVSVVSRGRGVHSDKLNGLYLVVGSPTTKNPKGSRSWIVRYTSPATKTRREKSIGGADVSKGGSLSLTEARNKAADFMRMVRGGVDPVEAEKAVVAAALVQQEEDAKAAMTFGEYAVQVLADIQRQFKNTKHRKQWEMTLRDYAKPLNGLAIEDITQDHIVDVFRQVPKSETKRGGKRVLWAAVPETARRLRGRLEDIFAHAKADGYKTGDNPAALTKDLAVRLDRLNDSAKPAKGHFARLDHDKLPAFMIALRSREGIAARALELLILTAARSGEVRGAVWSEFDFDLPIPVWTMPAERTKSGREHIVPLSLQALKLLRQMQPDATLRHGLVFPGKPGGKGESRPLSDMTLTAVLRRMKRSDITAHGFRSTFRDWAGDETEFARGIIEASLAHVIRDKTEAAYARNTQVKKRSVLMTAWADFCLPAPDRGATLRLVA